MSVTTAQIGRAGELLVQLRLIQNGIDSSPMTTDSGIDLVALSPRSGQAVTIQVKTNQKPKPGGGRGKPALDWWIPENSPANFIALVDLLTSRVWLLSMNEVTKLAQQHSKRRYHLFMYTDPTVRSRKALALDTQFQPYLLENCLAKLF